MPVRGAGLGGHRMERVAETEVSAPGPAQQAETPERERSGAPLDQVAAAVGRDRRPAGRDAGRPGDHLDRLPGHHPGPHVPHPAEPVEPVGPDLGRRDHGDRDGPDHRDPQHRPVGRRGDGRGRHGHGGRPTRLAARPVEDRPPGDVDHRDRDRAGPGSRDRRVPGRDRRLRGRAVVHRDARRVPGVARGRVVGRQRTDDRADGHVLPAPRRRRRRDDRRDLELGRRAARVRRDRGDAGDAATAARPVRLPPATDVGRGRARRCRVRRGAAGDLVPEPLLPARGSRRAAGRSRPEPTSPSVWRSRS